jgi:hypothetical protein
MSAVAGLLGAFVILVPEGGAPWMYLLLASAACAGAIGLSIRIRTRRRSNG